MCNEDNVLEMLKEHEIPSFKFILHKYVPVLINLKELFSNINRSKTVHDKILEYLKRQLNQMGFAYIYPHVLHSMHQGHVLFLFDGMDELTPGNREFFVTYLTEFDKFLHKNKVFVFCAYESLIFFII